MARIHVSKPYTMPREAVREAVQALAEAAHSRHGVEPLWLGDSVSMKSRGVEGRLDFSGDTIDISVKLGLLASAFAPKLKREIQRYLDEHVT